MENVELLKLGAFCLQRMSLRAQKEMLTSAESSTRFGELVLSELSAMENGEDFLTTCGDGLDLSLFMNILSYCDQPTIDRIITDERYKAEFLRSGKISGHVVIENAAIYYTDDMDVTLRWFERVLGWSGVIEARDESGKGAYGLVLPNLPAYSAGNRSPYMQLMRGTPLETEVGFIKVWGLSNLRQRAIEKGWKQLTPIERQFWGADLFIMTTCDGSLLRFYEPVENGS